ncbi:MliC family protein [Cupriavidus sp. AU9028]|uniref:MliC family protein n=1 Tax=Cupriavidus sp. AU9028 TaxID=2871157 RepID=UPI001C95F075|nr:MliC family protein [Cupriavidus sp. AU9028]MBY4896293.1 MliC family protein [Cupriavidus sp. AU9028]
MAAAGWRTTGARAALAALTVIAATGALAPLGATAGQDPARAAGPRFDGLQFEPPRTVQYLCEDGARIAARYFNSADNQLAIVTLDGRRLLFVTVLSGSGARYAHGPLIWWTRGDEAMLLDQTRGEQAPPVHAGCRAQR